MDYPSPEFLHPQQYQQHHRQEPGYNDPNYSRQSTRTWVDQQNWTQPSASPLELPYTPPNVPGGTVLSDIDDEEGQEDYEEERYRHEMKGQYEAPHPYEVARQGYGQHEGHEPQQYYEEDYREEDEGGEYPEDEEYMNIEPDGPDLEVPGGFHDEETPVNEQVLPTTTNNFIRNPPHQYGSAMERLKTPIIPHQSTLKKKSNTGFVGGFFSGLRKIPKVVARPFRGNSNKEFRPIRPIYNLDNPSLPRHDFLPEQRQQIPSDNTRYVQAMNNPKPMTTRVAPPAMPDPARVTMIPLRSSPGGSSSVMLKTPMGKYQQFNRSNHDIVNIPCEEVGSDGDEDVYAPPSSHHSHGARPHNHHHTPPPFHSTPQVQASHPPSQYHYKQPYPQSQQQEHYQDDSPPPPFPEPEIPYQHDPRTYPTSHHSAATIQPDTHSGEEATAVHHDSPRDEAATTAVHHEQEYDVDSLRERHREGYHSVKRGRREEGNRSVGSGSGSGSGEVALVRNGSRYLRRSPSRHHHHHHQQRQHEPQPRSNSISKHYYRRSSASRTHTPRPGRSSGGTTTHALTHSRPETFLSTQETVAKVSSFLRELGNLPWIAQTQITRVYTPLGGGGNGLGMKGGSETVRPKRKVKKSWYTVPEHDVNLLEGEEDSRGSKVSANEGSGSNGSVRERMRVGAWERSGNGERASPRYKHGYIPYSQTYATPVPPPRTRLHLESPRTGGDSGGGRRPRSPGSPMSGSEVMRELSRNAPLFVVSPSPGAMVPSPVGANTYGEDAHRNGSGSGQSYPFPRVVRATAATRR